MAKPPKVKPRDLAAQMNERELQTTLRIEEEKLRALLDETDKDSDPAGLEVIERSPEADAAAEDEFESDGESIAEALIRATGEGHHMIRATPTTRARPVTPPSADPVSTTTNEEMLRWAERMESDGAEEPALAICERVLAGDPDNVKASELARRLRGSLGEIAERRLGNLDRVPSLLVSNDKLKDRNLDPRTRLLLEQIDGQTSYRQLLTLPGVRRDERLRALAQLLREGLIGSGA